MLTSHISEPYCWMQGNYVIVKLGEGTSLQENDTLSFRANTIQERGVDSGLAVYLTDSSTMLVEQAAVRSLLFESL